VIITESRPTGGGIEWIVYAKSNSAFDRLGYTYAV